MKKYYAVWLFFFLMSSSVECSDDADDTRNEKLISTFQIVRFPNDVCVGTNSRNGTCYTSAECSDKSGTSAGSCADGFGVCCVFLITSCGSSSSENITYWTKPTSQTAGTCDLTVCPKSEDVCAIRLDFTSFTITGPSTLTAAQFSRKLGRVIANHEDVDLSEFGDNGATNCLLDTFHVTSASPSSAPPMICGVNTGYHMYTEADVDRCNKLVFNLADSASSGTVVTNSRGVLTLATWAWDITASQIECSSATLPPVGCTQYFYGGASTYTLNNYNWQSTTVGTANTHLAQQHQRICIRKERGKCVGCFSAITDAGLAISGRGETDVAVHYTGMGTCCSYMTTDASFMSAAANAQSNGEYAAGTAMYGFDCIVIPGAYTVGNHNEAANEVWGTQTAALLGQLLLDSPTDNGFPTPVGPQICGNGKGIGVGGTNIEDGAWEDPYAGSAITNTLCSRVAPFVLEFITDDLESGGPEGEFVSATQADNQGFNIYHTQLDC
jgi:hypothetical protein